MFDLTWAKACSYTDRIARFWKETWFRSCFPCSSRTEFQKTDLVMKRSTIRGTTTRRDMRLPMRAANLAPRFFMVRLFLSIRMDPSDEFNYRRVASVFSNQG